MIGHILSLVTFLPLFGGIILLLFPSKQEGLLKVSAFIISIVAFLISLTLWFLYEPNGEMFQFVEKYIWIKGLNTHYFMGIDGMSLLLILLTTFLVPVTLLGTWNSISQRLKEYLFLVLALETAMIGAFAALDLFLFYVFFEAILIPMYFIIGIWGGKERIYAAVKFFLFTLVGSLFMLIAIIALGVLAGQESSIAVFTTDLLILQQFAPGIAHEIQVWLFAAFALSFAIKVPLFPFHTWLPDAHVQAPTAGSVILAGVLLKLGTYGLIRFNLPLIPSASEYFAPFLSVLAVIGIVYGALVAMVQTDIKKLVAYSSVSHLGFVVLGIFAFTEESIQGAIIQMINHGLSTGALFLLVGMIYDKAHTRTIQDFGGVAHVMPIFATIFLIVSLSSIGLPGLNGFIGEFLILLGAFKSEVLDTPAYAIVGASGVIFAAVYLLWMYNRVFWGPRRELYGGHVLSDISVKEIASLVPIIFLIIWIGIYPSSFLSKSAPLTKSLVKNAQELRSTIILSITDK